MKHKYKLGERLYDGLHELYRNDVKTNAKIASLDLIKSNSVYITGGTFRGGTFYGGTFYGGTFRGGTFHGGTFRGGYFRDGTFRGGDFRDGTFLDGAFLKGTFRGGDFRDGAFHGGIFYDGIFHGGTLRGGTFHGGEFFSGRFLGGDFYETPLQISGSKHYLNYTAYKDAPSISIGCHTFSIEYWLEKYEAIGKGEGYSSAQIDEYKAYIDLFALRYLK